MRKVSKVKSKKGTSLTDVSFLQQANIVRQRHQSYHQHLPYNKEHIIYRSEKMREKTNDIGWIKILAAWAHTKR